MSQEQDRQQQPAPAARESGGGPLRPTPDEAGPHDVPDEKVIEKTLPNPGARRERDGGAGQGS